MTELNECTLCHTHTLWPKIETLSKNTDFAIHKQIAEKSKDKQISRNIYKHHKMLFQQWTFDKSKQTADSDNKNVNKQLKVLVKM